MRILHRASLVLSLLGAAPGQPLDDIAGACGLPRSTCARLLVALADLGWVEHHAGRGGWQLGPRAQALAEGRPYRTALLAAAEAPLRAAARVLGQPVALSVLAGTRRMVLARMLPDGTCDRRLVADPDHDLPGSSTGRLLIAMLPPAQRRRLCAVLGLPDPRRWPGAVDARELTAELRMLARERTLRQRRSGSASTAVVCPDGAGGWAALGTFGRTPEHPRTLAVLRRTATRIAAALARQPSIVQSGRSARMAAGRSQVVARST